MTCWNWVLQPRELFHFPCCHRQRRDVGADTEALPIEVSALLPCLRSTRSQSSAGKGLGFNTLPPKKQQQDASCKISESPLASLSQGTIALVIALVGGMRSMPRRGQSSETRGNMQPAGLFSSPRVSRVSGIPISLGSGDLPSVVAHSGQSETGASGIWRRRVGEKAGQATGVPGVSGRLVHLLFWI
jgi:hypothetical protein